ncbi:hypothetical protein [Desulfospira joergensenii]|nr:hypothetical protein [Desulfospira joergensenii]
MQKKTAPARRAGALIDHEGAEKALRDKIKDLERVLDGKVFDF